MGALDHAVWYSYTATNSDLITASNSGSVSTEVFSAYEGACGDLAETACNADSLNVSGDAYFSFTGEPGKTYFFQVAPSGSYTFNLMTTAAGGAVPINEYPVLTSSSAATSITAGPDGNMWFTERDASKIGRVTKDGVVTEFSTFTPNSGPLSITTGPDGKLWFTESNVDRIARMGEDGFSGSEDEYAISSIPLTGPINHITTGSDGLLWFTISGSQPAIGKSTTDGDFSATVLLPAGSAPYAIALGPDGDPWYTDPAQNAIGSIDPTGAAVSYTIPTASCNPRGITRGPDGNLWFTEATGPNIGRITTAGDITEFPIPSQASAQGIATGPDGNLWFTETTGNFIGRLTTDGVFVGEFPVPTGSSAPQGIATGPDGNVWFAEQASDKVAQLLTPKIVDFPAAPNAGAPQHIVEGPDGLLWYDDNYMFNAVYRVRPNGVIVNAIALATGSNPAALTLAPDNNVWVAENGSSKLGMLGSDFVEEYPTLTTPSSPRGIVGGDDGNLWFTEEATDSLTRLNLSMDGSACQADPSVCMSRFPIVTTGAHPFLAGLGGDLNVWFTQPGADKVSQLQTDIADTTCQAMPSLCITEYSTSPGSQPYAITGASDEATWFTEPGTHSLGRIDDTAVLTEFPIPSLATGVLRGIAAGPLSDVWFAAGSSGKIGWIDLDTQGSTLYRTTSTASGPLSITMASSGQMWFTDATPPYHIGRINPTGNVNDFSLPVAGASSIVTGPDGNLWFTQPNSNAVGQLKLDGTVTTFTVPSTNGLCSAGSPGQNEPCATDGDCAPGTCVFGPGPQAITAGLDGNLWFTEQTANVIARLKPALADASCISDPTVCITEYRLASGFSEPSAITTGLDGDIWVVAQSPARVVRLVPAQADLGCDGSPGVCMTEFPMPTSDGNPVAIATGADGTIWIAEHDANQIASLVPKLADASCVNTPQLCITEYPIPTIASGASGISAGNDGNVWFTEYDANQIGRITAMGTITEFNVPAADNPLGITRGPDGNVWFTELSSGGRIGRITPSGSVTEYFFLNGANPTGISVGPDGNVWFTRADGDIGRISP